MEGGCEKVLKQTFKILPDEQLKISHVCCLSTSAGPLMGVMCISTAKMAFCSNNPLSYKVENDTKWSYYTVKLIHFLVAFICRLWDKVCSLSLHLINLYIPYLLLEVIEDCFIFVFHEMYQMAKVFGSEVIVLRRWCLFVSTMLAPTSSYINCCASTSLMYKFFVT